MEDAAISKALEAPYGSWASPITSESITSATIGLTEPRVEGQNVYWIEGRPAEGGRRVVVRRDPDGRLQDVNPPPFNARTRVHEYGGGAYCVVDGCVYFTHFADQRLYRAERDAEPEPLTPDARNSTLRFADFAADRRRRRLIAVREDHCANQREPRNELVAISLEGPNSEGGRVLVSGRDFYSTPRVSPDGNRLAWLAWDHPNMPWDGTELWVAEIAEDGAAVDARRVAGGPQESIFQPEWSPAGVLYFVSDRSGWWNLYRCRPDAAGGTDEQEPLAPLEAEFATPQWVFGLSTYGFARDGTLVCSYTQDGVSHLAAIAPGERRLRPIALPFTDLGGLCVGDGFAVFVAGAPTEPPVVARLELESGAIARLRTSSALEIDAGYISEPEPIEFPSRDGGSAHAFFYPPKNKDYRAPGEERPPLVVLSHGGPTAQSSPVLSLQLQYWTSRGFAVLDVNYGGSTGYGRAYRERLKGRWGIVDVDDCADGALDLAARGRVDGCRLAIRGWSASGYTTLAALTFRDVFKAGASHYGVSDLEALARDTHKFESRYLEGLVGPYPECKQLYIERSPIHFVDRLSAPLILFQGLEDKIVPPNQAELMYEAVKAKGIPVALVEFEGEQHVFRKAESIRRALDGELYFLGKIFGFEPNGTVERVPIANLQE